MKSLLFASALLILTPGIADAACSTAALAGKWTNTAGKPWCLLTVTRTGAVSGKCMEESVSGKVSLSSSCALSGKVNGAVITGRTDSGPNLFVISLSSTDDGQSGYRIP